MKIDFRKRLLTIEPDDDCAATTAAWLAAHAGQVFQLHAKDGVLRLHALGPKAEASREPLNITSRSPGPLRLISNFAHTPFVLDGLDYASIEGFWQGLKFPDEADRRRLAPLHGAKPKDEGYHAPASDVIVYGDRTVRVGTWDHWQLMAAACAAKFAQHDGARTALLSTAGRPLVHEIGRDSKTIPGVIMAGIWMQQRERLAEPTALPPNPYQAASQTLTGPCA